MKTDPFQYDEKPRPLHRRVSEWKSKYPIIFNLLLIIIASLIVIWLLLLFLNRWTLHGVEDVIPDVKGQNITQATALLKENGMAVEISDSIYDSTFPPGTVVEQNPHPMSRVKPGRTVYVTIVAYSPKMVSVPDLANVSLRQGMSMLQGLGFKKIEVRRVPSEYKDLVLGVRFNGLELRAGQKIPVSATITLEVGQGYEEEDENEIPEL